MKFIKLTDLKSNTVLVNMEDISEVANDRYCPHTILTYRGTFDRKTEDSTVTRVKETPEEIWEMIGAMK